LAVTISRQVGGFDGTVGGFLQVGVDAVFWVGAVCEAKIAFAVAQAGIGRASR